MVLDCLRYWAEEYHIDGFRFDLASILGRDPWGAPLANPPLLETLAFDPILAKCELIAEAWDAGGLYQVGSFPNYGRWAEWNGKYRDCVRKFLKGDLGLVGEMAQRLTGSPDIYQGANRPPTSSINFIIAHDGFTLADLVSYNEKHNLANGENNNDGANDNESWNCGVEGPTDNPDINRLRNRQIKNAMAILLVSQGVPMMLMGDEVGRTKKGNNNTYCHDNDLNWFDWNLVSQNASLFRFVKNMIAFRHAHPVLRSPYHLQNRDYVGSGYGDITWHGTKAWNADWSGSSTVIAFMLCGKHAQGATFEDNYIYVAINMHYQGLPFELPQLPLGLQWHLFANTGVDSPDDIYQPNSEPLLNNQTDFLVGDRSVVILVGK
jgi:glycogen operon protein